MLSTCSLIAVLIGTAHAETQSEPTATTVTIPYEKYTLENGLEVILAEDHSIPSVQVNLWYRVGSKDEVEGRTGFAHLFEHLMFQGSEHNDGEYFTPLQAIGARINGTTNFDRTNYFEQVPSEYLPLALWLESDRMGWLLPVLDEAKLENQKLVVRNERRQSYENRPYGQVRMWLYETLYPEEHPYHVPTIGRHEDIDAATLEDVSEFFQTWYGPNNASLSICGDFDFLEARELVETYFGSIPRGPTPEPATPQTVQTVTLTEETVLRKEDDVPHDKVWIAWLTPRWYGQGDADLDIISSVLSSGKESRLYSHLVHDLQIARSINAYQASSLLQSVYIIEATAATGHTTDEIVAQVDAVLHQLRTRGPTEEEVQTAIVNWESGFFDDLSSIWNKGDRLNMYNVVHGDPGWIGNDLARYQAVTATSALNTVQTWLPPDRRVVLHVTPAPTETPETTEESGR
ncbi:MAG: pitrilysin family protein [Myxococcota bacterium]|jgi:predicted Zn-dependent peptidase|nr:pitrilysin family protein [Myxococcota bacterium]